MTPSNAFTYSSARRMSNGSETHSPSWEKPRAGAGEAAIVPSSASRSPASPTVTAPMGCTVAYPADTPRLATCSTTPAVTATGSAFAIANTTLKPPRSGSLCAGEHCFTLLVSGFPQVSVQVNQAGEGQKPVRVNAGCSRSIRYRAKLRNDAVPKEDVSALAGDQLCADDVEGRARWCGCVL